MKWNIKMKKKHHCKWESENIQYNKLNNKISQNVLLFCWRYKGDTINGALTFRILGPMLSVPVDLFMSRFKRSCSDSFIFTGGIANCTFWDILLFNLLYWIFSLSHLQWCFFFIISRHMYQYLTKYNLLHDAQSGFRSNHSC
jgi:hypothetical protein